MWLALYIINSIVYKICEFIFHLYNPSYLIKRVADGKICPHFEFAFIERDEIAHINLMRTAHTFCDDDDDDGKL